jgi:hypothetical protein
VLLRAARNGAVGRDEGCYRLYRWRWPLGGSMPIRDDHSSSDRIPSLPGTLVRPPALPQGRSVTLPPAPRRARKPCRQPIRPQQWPHRLGAAATHRRSSSATGDISFPPSVAKRRMVSASQPACGLNSPTSHPPSSLKRAIISPMLPHYCPCASPNEIIGSTGATNRGCWDLR